MPAPSRLLIGSWYFASYRFLAYKQILAISCWWFIRLINAFAFPDPQHQAVNICMDGHEFATSLDNFL